MKILSTILAILILSISLIPCDDAMLGYGDEKIHLAEQNGHNDDHNNKDNCSPFCMCDCCHSHVVVCEKQQDNIIDIEKITLTPYSVNIYPLYTFGFWRPPQV